MTVTKHIIGKLSSSVEDSQKQIEKYTETILQRLSEHKKQLECQGLTGWTEDSFRAPEKNTKPKFSAAGQPCLRRTMKG